MGFLKDMKQAFRDGMNAVDKEQEMIDSLKGHKVTATEAREVFMKIKENELEEEFLEWVSDNEIKLK